MSLCGTSVRYFATQHIRFDETVPQNVDDKGTYKMEQCVRYYGL